MRLLRAVADVALGLFVGDWVQALGILAILAAGWLASRRVHAAALGFLVALLLAGHLVYTTTAAARRRARQAGVAGPGAG